jgi:hypothetical protein
MGYARRVGGRVTQAIRQLPTTDECWVAIFWSNGAPIDAVHAAVRWDEIPAHVAGLILVGCGVIFGHPQIHCFTSRVSRYAREEDDVVVRSTHPDADEVAALVFDTFERSSGVRPTLLRVGSRTLLQRIGEQRILPFNLLMAADPPGLDRQAIDAPWGE